MGGVEDNPKKSNTNAGFASSHLRTMHNDHTIVGGARSNARAANQNSPGYAIKNIDNIDNFHDVTRSIIDNVTEAHQNYNQGVKYYVSLDVEFKKMLEDTIRDPPVTFRTEM